MFDIGFFELLVIGVVLLIVMGPEKLPEVAKQAAFFVRKARQGMFRLRSEMREELEGTPFADFQKAQQEIADLKRDIRQMGTDLADAADQKIGAESSLTSKDAEGSLPSTKAESSLSSTEAEGSLPSTKAEGSLSSTDAEGSVSAAKAGKSSSSSKG